MNCKICSGPTKKFGRFENKNRIVQRYRCTCCGKTFSEIQPLDGLCVQVDKVVQVVHLLTEGVGIRASSRLTGLDVKTVLKTLTTVGADCAKFHERTVKNVKSESVQTDELYSFVHCKQERNVTHNPEWGEQYTFLSLCVDSKLILSHQTGKRTHENAFYHLADVKQRIKGRTQLSTDNFAGYPGDTGAVRSVFGEDGVDYGMISKVYANSPDPSKQYAPPVCILQRKFRVLGRPNSKLICTSHIERQNLNVRLFNRRFTRLTIGYSKKLANLKFSLDLLVCYWNFYWKHHTSGKTPAQAAGLTDHIWTVKELVETVINHGPATI